MYEQAKCLVFLYTVKILKIHFLLLSLRCKGITIVFQERASCPIPAKPPSGEHAV